MPAPRATAPTVRTGERLVTVGRVIPAPSPAPRGPGNEDRLQPLHVSWGYHADKYPIGEVAKSAGPDARDVYGSTPRTRFLEFEGTRRMIVNGCLWAVGLEDKIPEKTNVDLVGTYKPTPFRFKGSAEWQKNPVKPADLVK